MYLPPPPLPPDVPIVWIVRCGLSFRYDVEKWIYTIWGKNLRIARIYGCVEKILEERIKHEKTCAEF